MRTSFFGASVAPGKPFKSTGDSSLHLSRAAVTLPSCYRRVTLCVTVGEGTTTYSLGTLAGTNAFLRMNLRFMPEDGVVEISAKGDPTAVVHITGHYGPRKDNGAHIHNGGIEEVPAKRLKIEAPPPVVMVNEDVPVPGTNGQLTKKVITTGTPHTKPNNFSKVTVHYTGTLTNGKKFDSSRGGKPFVFRVGAGEVIKGWDTGVATMNTGEKSVLTCAPSYGYGAKGSRPEIPPNTTLKFEVELLSWR